MASEAARQKYPEGIMPDHVTELRREAYDAGRVDALREAAEGIRHKQHPESVRQMLNAMADRIEKEARG